MIAVMFNTYLYHGLRFFYRRESTMAYANPIATIRTFCGLHNDDIAHVSLYFIHRNCSACTWHSVRHPYSVHEWCIQGQCNAHMIIIHFDDRESCFFVPGLAHSSWNRAWNECFWLRTTAQQFKTILKLRPFVPAENGNNMCMMELPMTRSAYASICGKQRTLHKISFELHFNFLFIRCSISIRLMNLDGQKRGHLFAAICTNVPDSHRYGAKSTHCGRAEN